MTPGADPEVVEVAAQPAAVVAGEVPVEALPEFFDRSFGELGAAIADQGLVPAGAAFARYHGAPAELADLEVGFPLTGPVSPVGSVAAGELPGGRVARVVHAGGFEGLGDAWGQLAAWIAAQGLTPSPDLWEVYLTEPTPEMDPADLRTELNWRLDP